MGRRLCTAAFAALACGGKPPADSGPVPTDDSAPTETSPPDDTDPPALPATCAPPDALPADPITARGSVQYTLGDAFILELVDVQLDGSTAWAAGQGGVLRFDVTDADAPVLVAQHSPVGMSRFHRVEPLGGGIVAATVRDERVVIVDMDRAPPAVLLDLGAPGAEGLAAADGLLHVTTRGTGLLTLDVSDPAAASFVASTPGLDRPWELSAVVDGWAYAADAALGVVPIDLTDPRRPAIGAPVPLDGVLHVAATATHLFASLGTGGVAVLDRADPAAPVEVARVQTGGAATMAAVDGDLLAVADHEGLAALDVSDPAAPRWIGRETTPQFALAVDVADGLAWVGDWSILAGYDVDPTALAGELDLPLHEVLLPEDGGDAALEIVNRGGATLALTGATVTDDRVRVVAADTALEPGDAGTVTLAFDGGDALDATLCVASTDPDAPVIELPVRAGVSTPPIGSYAPDFALVDLATGETRRLSDHLGEPVFLALFAYW